MPLLLALLVVAYIGSLYTSAARKRSFASASGIEFVLLGALLGPRALGVLSSQAVQAFDPFALMALGWIGLGYGVDWGVNRGRRAPFGRILLGCVLTSSVAATIACAVFAVGNLLHWLPPERLLLASSAAALVSAETTRHALRWVSERRSVQGPLSSLLGDMASADDAPVMIGLSALFALHVGPLRVAGVLVPIWGSALGTLGLGAILGLLCAYLTYRDRSTVIGWSCLLGCACLAAGFTTSLGLSAMGATFSMGLALGSSSPIGADMRARIVRTEGSLLLPALLLAGARLELPEGYDELLLIGTALFARLLVNYLIGASLALSRKAWRPSATWLGFAMSSSGTLTMMVGLALSLGLDEQLGQFVLTCAALGTLFGELLGPLAMRRALERAGEVSAPSGELPEPSGAEVVS